MYFILQLTFAALRLMHASEMFSYGTGPILLEDYHLVEKLANFDRERIPERVVHARGASAKGFFEVTHDISHLTCADFLRAPGVQTPVIVRFSTVIHERGSPETLRDPRGFAVKFYTREVRVESIQIFPAICYGMTACVLPFHLIAAHIKIWTVLVSRCQKIVVTVSFLTTV